MVWSDVANKVIVKARLNGTGLSILVNSNIDVPGNSYLLVCVNRFLSCIVRLYKAKKKKSLQPA